MRIIQASQVRKLLPISECIEVIDAAMRAVSGGRVTFPDRQFMPLPEGKGAFVLMPGAASDPAVYGIKALGLQPNNPLEGRPAIQGFVALFDLETGEPVALMDGAEVTAQRTAAASAVATRALAPQGAKTHGVFGTGVQAISHIEAISCVRSIDKVLVWGRDYERTQVFASEQEARTGQHIIAIDDPTLVAQCDIVTTVTGSKTPILKGDWLKPGCHVNAVGAHSPNARELDTESIKRAKVFTDFLGSAHNEAGEFIIPVSEKAYSFDQIQGEIGSVLIEDIEGRSGDNEITLYKSLGIVMQDIFAASHVYRSAEAKNVGVQVELDQ